MSETWHSLYLRADDTDAVAAALIDALRHHGYQRYDPFAGGTGTPPGLKSFIKHFVAPPTDGWVHVLGEPDPSSLVDLSAGQTLLYTWLTATNSGIDVYSDGATDPEGIVQYLRPGKTISDLARAQQGDAPAPVDRPTSAIPNDMQPFARDHNVNPDQANRMIERLTSRLFGKLDRASGGEASTMQAQARALAMGANRLDWNSPAAQRLKAMVGVLSLPSNWRGPDFDAVREAYQAARMRRKNPNSQLFPDEQAALNALPDVLKYEAVYMGK
jgi:hypothetical protein